MHLYIPVEPPPTPAPSPGPNSTSSTRLQYLTSVLNSCTQAELRFISVSIAPLLKRDFLRDLPFELALHVLGYVDDPCSLMRVAQVSKRWRDVVGDDSVWRKMCVSYRFPVADVDDPPRSWGYRADSEPLEELEEFADKPMDPALEWLSSMKRRSREKPQSGLCSPWLPSCFSRFKYHYMTLQNWRYGGQLVREYPAPMPRNHAEGIVITCVALDSEWVVVASEDGKIHVFFAETGILHRMLVGHPSGVWSVGLISRGGRRRRCQPIDEESPDDLVDEPHSLPLKYREALGFNAQSHADTEDEDEDLPSHPSGASEGWGQSNAIVVSAGCDQVVRVWDVESGFCIYTLAGHTATVRCLKVTHHSPTAVTGARDDTLRVWDIQKGKQLRVLEGHSDRVRCLDVWGRRVVSGSYDWTCRVWDIDTGECIHVLRGHQQQVYCVAFNGTYIVSGGLDTVVRVWDANTGAPLSVLTGHTTLVCQLQLSPQPRPARCSAPNFADGELPPDFLTRQSSSSSSSETQSSQYGLPYSRPILATGGSDGRVITYDLESRQVLHRIAAHDAPITALQFDENFIVSSGTDGRVRVFATETGKLIRDWYGAEGGRNAFGSTYAYGVETGSVIGPPVGMRGGNGRYERVWKVVFGGSMWGAGERHSSKRDGSNSGRDICAVMCRKPDGRSVMEIWRMSPKMDQIGGDLS
ncbi:hypothetical protein ONZ45_g6745 [Pleurotus djamor]|nr:hypothetical protein ONZ45_g6745 [Pleurotus djamor]